MHGKMVNCFFTSGTVLSLALLIACDLFVMVLRITRLIHLFCNVCLHINRGCCLLEKASGFVKCINKYMHAEVK